MFAVFRSLHMKLMLILLLLITSLMAVVGAFLTTSVSSFYIDTFYEQISAVFSDDSDGYVSTLRARAAEPDGAAGIKEMLEGRAGSLGIDYRTRNYYVLDGTAGTYLAGSAAGGLLAGIFGKKIPVLWLHRILGIFILWGGIRNLCRV